MVRHKLDSVNAFARKRYWLHIQCDKCGHVAVRAPAPLLIELQQRKLRLTIDQLERRVKCTSCGHRGARISACEPRD